MKNWTRFMVVLAFCVTPLFGDMVDNFDGSALDTNKWTNPTAGVTCAVGSGKLTMTPGNYNYASGYITAKDGLDSSGGTMQFYALFDSYNPTDPLDPVTGTQVVRGKIGVVAETAASYYATALAGLQIDIYCFADSNYRAEIWLKGSGLASNNGTKIATKYFTATQPLGLTISIDDTNYTIDFSRQATDESTQYSGTHGWNLATDLPTGHLNLEAQNYKPGTGSGEVLFDSASQTLIPEPTTAMMFGISAFILYFKKRAGFPRLVKCFDS